MEINSHDKGEKMRENISKIAVATEEKRCDAAHDFYGLFFEDINRAGDSGLYPEMLRNRSFEDSIPPHDVEMFGEDNAVLMNKGGWPDVFNHGEGIPRWTKDLPYTPVPAWYADGAKMELSDKTLNDKREAALAVTFEDGRIYNVGYNGVPVEGGKEYAFYCFAASDDGISLTLSLESKSGKVLASETLEVKGEYQKYDLTFKPTESDFDAIFVIKAKEGSMLLGFTSLMPTETYKGHGLRKDLCEMLKGLHAKFMRFPGGCIVEGLSKSTVMRFSRTIGPVWERPSHLLMWHYRATNGLGYHEYLQLCEDLEVAPLYVCNVGLTCQARVAELFEGDELDEMLEEAFGALEYAMGDVTTKYGKMRAENGHPEPFKIKYVEIGNENFGPDYFPRYKKFYDALKEKYPDIIYISNTHTEWEGLPTEVVDEHYYDTPNFFSEHADMFDCRPKDGPKIFLGEYATIGGEHVFNLNCALHESAWLLGAERNQDVVTLTSFAPLFQNVSFTSWAPNLILFDNHRVHGIPTYHALSILGKYHGTEVVKTEVETGDYCLGFTGLCGIQGDNGLKFKNVKVNGKPVGVTKRMQNDVAEENGVYTMIPGGEGEVSMTNNDGPINSLWGEKMRTFQLERNQLPEAKKRRELVSIGFGEEIREGTYEIDVFCEENTQFALSLWNHLFIEPYGIEEPKLKGWSLRSVRNQLWRIDGATGAAIQRPFWIDKIPEDFIELPIKLGEYNTFKVELKANKFFCYVNGQLVQEQELPTYRLVHASADTDGNDIYLKMINLSDEEEVVQIELDTDVESVAEGDLLTGDPLAQNSMDTPNAVCAKPVRVEVAKQFAYRAPAHSLTALKLVRK